MAEIKFKINGKDYTASGAQGPDVSLNEYIRSVCDLRGTKAMCHEGGCGACVVAVRAPHPRTQDWRHFAVNSCLVSALSCHGWEVTTVEGLGSRTAGYHELQTRLANFGGSQCGYCTPGWVMNMYSLYESKNRKLTAKEVENSFAGNICRCTGYRPIADAFKSFATDADQALLDKVADLEDLGSFQKCGVKCSFSDQCSHKRQMQCNGLLGKGFSSMSIRQRQDSDEDWSMLEYADNKMIVIDCGTHTWYKAYTLQDVFEAMGDATDYKLVAGNTGQGVFPFANYPRRVVDVFSVAELKGHSIDVNLVLGAGTPLAEMMELFLTLAATNEDFSYLKQFREHMDLVAHIPVRNIGTIAGNLFLKYHNNEFQSDVFLLFESVGAVVTVASKAKGEERLSMLDFLRTEMRGRVMVNVLLPPLARCCTVKTYKIMPRSQNAHAVVNAAFLFRFDKKTNHIEKASLVFGAISPKFNHAYKTEQALVGKDLFTDETLQLALKTLHDEIQPEEAPPEPSGAYRKMLAVSLFYKAILYLCPDDRINSRYRSGGEVIKRSTSKGTQVYDTDKSLWPLTQPVKKLEGLAQCAGEATFANDLPTQVNEVFGSFVLAETTPGSIILGFDASEALKLPGVIAFYTAKDIPGDNTFTPKNVPIIIDQEEILCSKTVLFHGQPAGIIVANRERLANKAAKLVKVKYATAPSKSLPLITIDDVLDSPLKSSRVTINQTVQPTETGNDIKTVIYGEYKIDSQYHYTMEPQTCVTKPTEDGFEVYSSTQWMDLTNVAVAQAIKVPANSVNVIVRRVGGAYGAKISRATQVACASALVSRLLGTTCRFVLPLVTNMKAVGKRSAVRASMEFGVNKDGVVQYLKNRYLEDNGCSNNDTIAPITIFHFYNCYDHRRWFVEAGSVYTDTPSATWCRAPGSTEGIAMSEYVMEMIAETLNLDPIEVRLKNMKKDSPMPDLIDKLKKDANFDERKEACDSFNRNNRWRKRAIKLVTMSYDLFYFGNFNSVISILHSDASIIITHGGIEMGQGINTKVAQVAAYILGAPLEKVSVKPSTSFTSPNAIVTGGSIGSECVSFATMKACQILLERLGPIKEKLGKPGWQQLIEKAYAEGVDLQASYMYTSKDNLKNYDIFGVVALEVEVDVLTGNHEVLRVDLLEDTGRSISPEVDVGQIEGAFIMGLGYWTSEKLMYDRQAGELITNRTWTYKPPGMKDVPADMRIYFRRNSDNPSGVLQSKATGEPAFCMAVAVTHAIREAVSAARLEAGYPKQWVDIEMPYTTENIFTATEHKLSTFKLK